MAREAQASFAAQARPGDLEFELKLAGPAPAVRRAFELLAAGEPDRTRHLVSTYFDTADRRLAAKGYTLRLRQSGSGATQTLKADRTAPARLELECDVAGLRPDLAAFRDPGARQALGAVLPEELETCFVTDVQRRTCRVSLSDEFGRAGEAEIAHDRGHLVLGNGSREPIDELEIESKSGDRQAVFTLAERAVAAGVSRLVVRSKAARGHDLATGRPPSASKATRVRLERDLPLGRALGEIFENCFAQWYANHDAAFDGRDSEGVHQLRVAIRRLRSALSSFGRFLAPNRRAWLKDEAKAVMGALGPARDLDVFIEELLPPVAETRPNDAALGAMRAAAADARALAYDRVRDMLESPRYARFLLEFGAWIERRGWLAETDREGHEAFESPVGPIADNLLARRAKVCRKRGRHFEELDVPARHQVRIALKKLRYAIDFTRDLYPAKRVKPYLAHLTRLQDAFGQMNDRAQAEALLDDLAQGDDLRLREARGLVLGWYGHAAGNNEAELIADWRAFEAAEPFWDGPGRC
ncbi:MAG: CHAD domain-containing protein [Pseudomonadota bacterium]